MEKNNKSVQGMIEEVTFILNDVRNNKLKKLEANKLSPKQEKIIEDIEKDLIVCVTKLGLLLHPTEL